MQLNKTKGHIDSAFNIIQSSYRRIRFGVKKCEKQFLSSCLCQQLDLICREKRTFIAYRMAQPMEIFLNESLIIAFGLLPGNGPMDKEEVISC